MKKQRHSLMALIIVAISLGLTGCSSEKKNTEVDTDNTPSVDPTVTEAETGTITDTVTATVTPVEEVNADPLINEVVTKPERQESGTRCVAYFTSWSSYDRALAVKDIDPTLLTHINFAFANLSENGEIMIGDEAADLNMDFGTELGGDAETAKGHFGQLRLLKEKYPHLKILISVGGWSWSKNFSDVAADPIKRDRFAASAAEFVTKYGFDGVDIDWEYPVEGGDNITHRVKDNENYEMFMKAIRKALNEQGEVDEKTYLLTIAARASARFILDANLMSSMQYISFINLMTYDYHGPWENMTGFNAPLYAEGSHASIDATVTTFIKSVNAADINLGLAFYGRGRTQIASTENNGVNQVGVVPVGIGYGLGTWESASFDAWDIIANYVGKNGYVRYYDETAQCPYVFDGTTWIGYDDEQSIKAKTEYAMEKGLGGVMFWDFSGDKNLALQTTIAETLGINGTK